MGTKDNGRRFLVGDSIEGWADAIKVLIKTHFLGKSEPLFDYRDIRPKGARLITSGGKAPGPDPLRICIDKIRAVLNGAIDRKLTTLEVHDINCHIADAVLSGGIRRAAMIALFSFDDLDMISCKSGMWWELNPQRGRANNSVVLHRETTTREQFDSVWKKIEESNAKMLRSKKETNAKIFPDKFESPTLNVTFKKIRTAKKENIEPKITLRKS